MKLVCLSLTIYLTNKVQNYIKIFPALKLSVNRCYVGNSQLTLILTALTLSEIQSYQYFISSQCFREVRYSTSVRIFSYCKTVA